MDSGNSERFLTRATLAQHVLGHGTDIGGAVCDRGAPVAADAGPLPAAIVRLGRAAVNGWAAKTVQGVSGPGLEDPD